MTNKINKLQYIHIEHIAKIRARVIPICPKYLYLIIKCLIIYHIKT